MATDNGSPPPPARNAEIYRLIDELCTLASKDPDQVQKILPSALEKLKAGLKEQSLADDELDEELSQERKELIEAAEVRERHIEKIDDANQTLSLINELSEKSIKGKTLQENLEAILAAAKKLVPAKSGAIGIYSDKNVLKAYAHDYGEHECRIGGVDIGAARPEFAAKYFHEIIIDNDRSEIISPPGHIPLDNILSLSIDVREGWAHISLANKEGKFTEEDAKKLKSLRKLASVIIDRAVIDEERKQSEKALKESERRFRDAIDHFPNVFVIYDADRRIQKINSKGLEILGLSEQDIIGRKDEDIFPPQMINSYLPALECAIKTKIPQTLERKRHSSLGGQTIAISIIPLLSENRDIRQILAISHDISEHKRMEDELEQRVQERTGALSEANKKLEAINLNLLEEIKAHAKARSELEEAKDNLGDVNEELKLEIEEEKRVEEQLLKARDAAEAAAKAKIAFLANMSHEIRTPMNSIIGFTELLLDEPLSPEQNDSLETIRLNGDVLLTIINDILDFSKMESDKVILEEQPFNIRSCVEESLDLVAVRASEKGLNLAYTASKNIPNTIIGDPGRLRQILGNLLSNAVKFTDDGEVVLSVSSQEVDETGTNEVHFSVQDTGIGIPKDNMDQLFTSFGHMEPLADRLYGGTGLGLAISKRLVEMMGGSIWAESEEGKGSTFHFIIKASSSRSEPEVIAVSPQMVGKRVLIIEDNKTNRRILSKQVYDWGMIPMAASSGQEALKYVQRGDGFDIAILDMDLQTMDSLELKEKLRKYNKALPLILLTSLGKRIPPDHATLTKPIKPSRLRKVLTEILPGQNENKPTLPQEQAQRQLKASAVNHPAHNSPLRILLAEDNISSQKVAQQMLKKMGYKVDTVANGIEVLQSLERQHYDVVLMDLKMPEMDGLEATRIIRQRWPKNVPKIIAITAFALADDKEKCLEAGMDGYIAKPVKKEDLAKVLKECRPEAY